MGTCCSVCQAPDGTQYGGVTKIKNVSSCPPPGYIRECGETGWAEYWWC